MAARYSLLKLPEDILIMIPDYLHNIEDHINLSSSCRSLKRCLARTNARKILRLAAAQSRIFFRPSPYFLVAATARELGQWARKSERNEHDFARAAQRGIDGLLDLALNHCGLTLERIRELHNARSDLINPVEDIVDKCVGKQWYSMPDFWDGGVDDAYTIDADASDTLFQFVIYGELFGPDFEAYLDGDKSVRCLKIATRLDYIRYCVPDYASRPRMGSSDPADLERTSTMLCGPYALVNGQESTIRHQNNIALTWTLRSSRWTPHWKAVRVLAGEDFDKDYDVGWWFDPDGESGPDFGKQRLWESVMLCQGWGALEMITPAKPELKEKWIEKVKQWRDKIATIKEAPVAERVGRQATLEYPFLIGDLRVCASGYVHGT